MCLAIPGKILSIDASGPLRMGEIDFGGIRKEVCLEWVPEAETGQYVIVHVGFAISVLDEAEARKTLDLFREMGDSGMPASE